MDLDQKCFRREIGSNRKTDRMYCGELCNLLLTKCYVEQIKRSYMEERLSTCRRNYKCICGETLMEDTVHETWFR
jgi:hypothetical protein